VGKITAPKLVTAQYMFGECDSLKNVGKLTMPELKNMSMMFYGCVSLKKVAIENVSSVNNMVRAFAYCEELEDDFSNWGFAKGVWLGDFVNKADKFLKLVGEKKAIEILQNNKIIDAFKYKAMTNLMKNIDQKKQLEKIIQEKLIRL